MPFATSQIPSGGALVAPSGTSVIVRFVDSVGASADVVGVFYDCVQVVTVAAASGTYTLSFGGQTTAAIAVGAPPSAVQSALTALSSVGTGNALVSGWGPYRVQFTAALGGVAQPLLTANAGGLSGSLPTPGTTAGTGAAVPAAATLTGSAWVGSAQSSGGVGSSHFCNVTGSGANYAVWTFGSLTTGAYSLAFFDYLWSSSVSFPAAPGTGVVYRFYDGATLSTATFLGHATVSQGLVNQDWVNLASVYCTTGTILVVMADDNATGGVFAADVQLVPKTQAAVRSSTTGFPVGGVDATVLAWFKSNGIAGSGNGMGIFQYGDRFSTFGVQQLPGSGIVLTGTFTRIAPSPAVFPVSGTNYCVLGSFTAGAAGSIYVNNVATASNIGGSLGGASGDVSLARWVPSNPTYPFDFDGTVLRAAVWNRALTSGEATTLYNGGTVLTFAQLTGGAASLLTGLVAWYDCDPAAPGRDSLAADALAATASNLTPLAPAAPADHFSSTSVTSSTAAPGSAGGPPTFVLNGGSATAFATPFYGNYVDASAALRQPFIALPLPAKVSPGDVLTVTVPAGSVVTAAGPVQGYTNLAVTNGAGVPILDSSVPAARSMALGWNVFPGDCFEPMLVYTNLAQGTSEGWIGYGGSPPIAYTSDGYPTNASWLAAGSPIIYKYLIAPSNIFDPTRGYPLAPLGHYTVVWDDPAAGVGSYSLDGTLVSSDTGHTTNNKAVYDLAQSGTFWGANTRVLCHGGDLTNLRVYGPDINPAAAPKFDPDVLSKMVGCRVVRTMSFYGTNGSSVVDYSDYPPATRLGYYTPTNNAANVSQISGYSGPAYTLPPNNYVKVTTSAAHGFKTGQTVVLGHTSDSSPFTVNLAGGGTTSYGGGPAIGYVLDATNFVFGEDIGATAAGTTTFSAGVVSAYVQQCGAPPARDGVDMVNAVDALNAASGLPRCDLWFNVSHGATDACVDAIGDMIAATLNPGLICWVELSNEAWNFGPGFPQFFYFTVMGLGVGLSRSQYYALRSAQVRERIRARFTAAGRDPSVVKQIYGGQASSTQHLTDILTYAKSHDSTGADTTAGGYSGPGPIQVDAVTIAGYFGPWGVDSNLTTARFDAVTVEQMIDMNDAVLKWGKPQECISDVLANKAALVASGYPNPSNIKFFVYEGGIGAAGLTGTSSIVANRSMAYALHPGVRAHALTTFRAMQAAGVDKYAFFLLAAPYGENGQASNYGVYKGPDVMPGLGDGTDGRADNRPLVLDGSGMGKLPDLSQAVSVLGSAWNTWAKPVTPNFASHLKGRGW